MILYVAMCRIVCYTVFSNGGTDMRVITVKSKNSESFYISYAYRGKNGKSTSKIFRKLGTLDELTAQLGTDYDGVMAWAKEQAKAETDKLKSENEFVTISLSPTQLIEKNKENSFNCGYLFLQSILTDLRTDNIFRNIKAKHSYKFNLESIFSDLVYARILEPCSKRASYDYCQSLLESPKYELHDVYRALPVLAENSDYIQSEFYRNSSFLHKRNTKVLYYDCTNYYFEIEQEDGDRQYGKSKENRPNPIIGMGLFMDGDGYPLAFDLHPGHQNEQLTLQPLEKKVIRDFDCANFIYCSDSGLSSQSNKAFNDMGGRSYVITQSLKKLKKDICATALDPSQYRKAGSKQFINLKDLDETDPAVYESIYSKEVPLEGKKVSETMIVTYSPKYKAYQKKIRDGQIERAMKMINENGKPKKSRKNPNDPARFVKTTAVTAEGEAADKTLAEIDQAAIENEAKFDGFYAVTTDIEGDVGEIIAINKRRWQIEECFRIMKTEFDARPVYVSREDSIKAHFLICFTSLLVYRLLETKLSNQYTVRETRETLKHMNVSLIEDAGYMPTYKRTDLTDVLHDTFGFRTDTRIIKKAKMRSIIKQTKEINIHNAKQ